MYNIHIYRAFHNVLRDYKYLQRENQRTYLNGIVHSHCFIRAVHLGTDHCSSEEWQELEYRIDVCRVTRGAHIEHL
jgi:hypothetical protein